MSYDPSHRRPPRQERWPTATPAEGWPPYRDGEQEDLRYETRGVTAGYQQQAVATAAYPAVTNGYDWSGNGYAGAAGGYAGAADDFDAVQDGYGRAGHGYLRSNVGYAEINDGYAGADNGYARADNGYARADNGYARADDGYARADDGYDWPDAAYAGDAGGYDWSSNGYGGSARGYAEPAHGYAESADGYGGGAYLGPGSYVEPGAVLEDSRAVRDSRTVTDNRALAGDPVLTAPDAGIRPDRWQAGQELRREAGRRGPMVGAVTEFLAIGVVIGVSTLAAALLKSATSPVSAMGAVFTERTPAALRNAVAHHFGAQGRPVLLLGMYVTFAVVAIVIGMMARRGAAIGVAGVAAFTLFAAFVTITRPGSHVADVIPVVLGGLAGVAAALWLFRASAPQMVQGPLRHGRGGTRRRTR
jgi:hypothetical protein